jgi:hypothetical protein
VRLAGNAVRAEEMKMCEKFRKLGMKISITWATRLEGCLKLEKHGLVWNC